MPHTSGDEGHAPSADALEHPGYGSANLHRSRGRSRRKRLRVITATKTVSADSGLASADKLLGLAKDLKGVSPDRMNMVTLPVRYDAEDPGRVLPLAKASHQVWQALRDDRPIPKSATENSVAARTDSPVSAGT